MQHRYGNRPLPPAPVESFKPVHLTHEDSAVRRLLGYYCQMVAKTYGVGVVLIFLGSPVVILHAVFWLTVQAALRPDRERLVLQPPSPETVVPLPPDLLWVRS